jgi:hypothetical protein
MRLRLIGAWIQLIFSFNHLDGSILGKLAAL